MKASYSSFEKNPSSFSHFQNSSGEAGSDSRILSLEKIFLHLVFDHVSQSLLKGDRLTFAMHLAHLLNAEKFQPNVR